MSFRPPTKRSSHLSVFRSIPSIAAALVAVLATMQLAAQEPTGPQAADARRTDVDYHRDVQPLLTKYCVGCHNQDDPEGKLSLESYTQLMAGGEHGQVVVGGRPDTSRLIRMVTGELEPLMPPEDAEAPTEDEIAVLVNWVKLGAKGPSGQAAKPTLQIPQKIAKRHDKAPPKTALAAGHQSDMIAVGSFREVEVRDADGEAMYRFDGVVGKVTDLVFSQDDRRLIAASGIAGFSGQVTIWDMTSGKQLRQQDVHRDMLYAVALSPDGTQLATGGYDRTIRIWDTETGELQQSLAGHNGAVYDLDFSPDGQLLVSASADETAKVWHVATGERLDTLGQPTAEVYCCAFAPDGQTVVAAGADNRIRVWRVLSRTSPRINPLVYSRFAHEAAITRLAFSADGKRLASVAEDRTAKVWDSDSLREIQLWEDQPEIISGLALRGNRLQLCRLDGSVAQLEFTPSTTATLSPESPSLTPTEVAEAPMQDQAEAEPNNDVANATPLTLPAKVTGVVGDEADGADEDWFRFAAKAGQQWIFEIDAARSKSPLDSIVEIRDSAGEPVPRVLLRAVRDSYFTFRGKDSSTSGDFRLQNWEEMELNEYLYCNGEVVRLWLYPRGPDSGFIVYPGFGSRHTFFDTTPNAHALHEPCYVVRPYPIGTELIPNGLPVFPVYYENDDDSQRVLGSDSRLTFTAPQTGNYHVRLRDVRGFEGDDYKYTLIVRPRHPDYRVTLHGANPTVNAGSGKEFEVRADRLDGFQGPIEVTIENIPAGYYATSPLVIEAGQLRAYGVLHAAADAEEQSEDVWKQIRVRATAAINDQPVEHDVNNLGTVKLAAAPQVTVRVVPADGSPAAEAVEQPWVLKIQPGQTVFAKAVVTRGEFKGRISFGNESSGRNLPHGVYVDNIGLNGLLIVEGKSEREFQITAAKWVEPGTRLFHLVANVDGNQASWPVLLQVE